MLSVVVVLLLSVLARFPRKLLFCFDEISSDFLYIYLFGKQESRGIRSISISIGGWKK